MPQVTDVTDPSFLEGLEAWPIDTVRARRDEATEIETGLSYLRRIVQGRLDIVVAAQGHRQRGESIPDVSTMVEELPSILGDHVHAPGVGRLPTLLSPGQLDAELESSLESALPAARLGTLPDWTDDDLNESVRALTDVERTVSGQRRALFDVLDRLDAELVRRYRTGEASVDSLLK